MNIQKVADMKYGFSEEDKLLNKFRQKIDPQLNKSKNMYDPFDYRSNNSLVELKSRRIRHNQYGDIMIGANKMSIATKTEKDVYFVFNCLDGIYYWKYNKEEYETNVEYRMGGTMKRGEDEKIECCFINTNILKPLD